MHIRGTNLSQFGARLRFAVNSRDQSVAIRRVAIGSVTTDCCTFAGPICRNSGHHYGLLQIIGTNLSQFGALRRIAAHSWDQSVATRRAAKDSCTIRDLSVAIQRVSTDCCTFGGQICRNSARDYGLLQIRGTNLSEFGALRRITAHSRDQSVAIQLASTNCCTFAFAGPICSNW